MKVKDRHGALVDYLLKHLVYDLNGPRLFLDPPLTVDAGERVAVPPFAMEAEVYGNYLWNIFDV